MPRPATPPFYPVVFAFNVKVTGITGSFEGSFQEVTGISAKLNTEPLKEGGENTFIRRLPLPPQYDNLVLKRGMLLSSDLIDWARDAIEKFTIKTKTVVVNLLDENQSPLASWTFANAYPIALKITDFKAQENSIACESIELAYENFTRTL
jgi:phage tail-like protein